MAQSNPYDLVILISCCHPSTGQTILRRLRSGGFAVPVLVLTARDDKDTAISVLNDGADDYVSKPSILVSPTPAPKP